MSGILARTARRIILAAVKGHQTYAETGPSDTLRTIPDPFAQCKCLACVIARAADIGRDECEHQRRATYARLRAEVDRQDREQWEIDNPDWDEVPF